MTLIEDEADIDPLRRLALQDFSYSRLNTFEKCELQYFYSYIIKEPQDFGHAAKLGNIIHEALEYTIEHGEPINLSELLLNYKAAREDYDPDHEISEDMIQEGEVMLQDYVNDHPGPIDVYAKELPFSFVLGRARFNGFIDFIDYNETRVKIRDYKSGKKEVTYKELPTNLQLGIYALVAKKLFPDKDVEAELYYLRKGKARGHLFTDDDLKQVENRLLEMTNHILDKESFVATPNERECNWCTYAKNGVCPTGALRLRRRGPSKY